MPALTCSPAETSKLWPKSTRSAAHSTRIASFNPFAIAEGSHCHFGSFSSWKQGSCWCPWWSAYGTVPKRRLGGNQSPLQQRDIPPPPRFVCDHLDRHLPDFADLAPLRGLQQAVYDWLPTLYGSQEVLKNLPVRYSHGGGGSRKINAWHIYTLMVYL